MHWDSISTYDDYLLEAAFDKSLGKKSRVLAAMKYGMLSGQLALMTAAGNYSFEDRLYVVFCEIIDEQREQLGLN